MSVTEEGAEPTEFKPTRCFDSESPSTWGSKNKKRPRQRQQEVPFRGVRKRSWGRYVSEIRLPGEKTRIWLGSFGSPEMAARAHDSAAFFLKGHSACLNFPDLAELLPRPMSCSRRDIQSAAAKAALFELAGNRSGLGPTEPETIGSKDFWYGLDIDVDLDLGTTSFEEVKNTPLLSPLITESFDGLITEEPGQFMDDEYLLASCFRL